MLTNQKAQVTLIINSFNGSSSEFQNSLDVVEYFKNKKLKVNSVIDINQELTFDKEKKITQNIRDSFHSMGKLFKLNSKYETPQIIINHTLAMTYLQFKHLYENFPSLFLSVLRGEHCHHLRFSGNALVYPTENVQNKEGLCIYCYSNTKLEPLITIATDARNSLNEMNNEILSFCEENELTFKLIDIENVFSCDISQYSKEIQNKMQSNSFFMIEKEKETYSLEQFWDVLDEWRKRKNKEGKCRKCGKMINPSSGIDICIDCCLSKNDSTLNSSNSSGYSSIKGKRNPYNFIEKLKLKKTKDYTYTDINAEDYLNEDKNSEDNNMSFN